MIDYRAGEWGFHVAFGWYGSLVPRAFTMALPNAILTVIVSMLLEDSEYGEAFRTTCQINSDTMPFFGAEQWLPCLRNEATIKSALNVIGAFSVTMIFILYNRSRTSYNRWWEGGTLLQKTRGEWFNAFSSIMAFTSTKPELQDQVDAYVHLLARLMSLLMCCGLQQVSPNRDRAFQILDLNGIDPTSMDFLNSAPDKVEIILQWIQRSMVLQAQVGVLPVAPPILSRAFQEVSRGIVNLQNARKIADFPYPFPLAQISMILQLLHWIVTPVVAALAFPLAWACVFSFASIFVLWCIHFNALDLEFPFGNRVNDLPMNDFQRDWNKSIITLLADRATRPPAFKYDPEAHNECVLVMSDDSDLYVPELSTLAQGRRNVAMIIVSDKKKRLPRNPNQSVRDRELFADAGASFYSVSGRARVSGRLRAQEHSDLIEAETKARKEAMDAVQSQVSRAGGASGKPGSSGTNAILQAEGTDSNQSNDILRKPNSSAAKGTPAAPLPANAGPGPEPEFAMGIVLQQPREADDGEDSCSDRGPATCRTHDSEIVDDAVDGYAQSVRMQPDAVHGRPLRANATLSERNAVERDVALDMPRAPRLLELQAIHGQAIPVDRTEVMDSEKDFDIMRTSVMDIEDPRLGQQCMAWRNAGSLREEMLARQRTIDGQEAADTCHRSPSSSSSDKGIDRNYGSGGVACRDDGEARRRKRPFEFSGMCPAAVILDPALAT